MRLATRIHAAGLAALAGGLIAAGAARADDGVAWQQLSPQQQQTLQSLPGYGGERAGEVLSLTQALPWWKFRARKVARAPR